MTTSSWPVVSFNTSRVSTRRRPVVDLQHAAQHRVPRARHLDVVVATSSGPPPSRSSRKTSSIRSPLTASSPTRPSCISTVASWTARARSAPVALGPDACVSEPARVGQPHAGTRRGPRCGRPVLPGAPRRAPDAPIADVERAHGSRARCAVCGTYAGRHELELPRRSGSSSSAHGQRGLTAAVGREHPAICRVEREVPLARARRPGVPPPSR